MVEATMKKKNESLSKQIYLLSVDSSAFMTNREKKFFDEQMRWDGCNKYIKKMEDKLKDRESIIAYQNVKKEFEEIENPTDEDKKLLDDLKQEFEKKNEIYLRFKQKMKEKINETKDREGNPIYISNKKLVSNNYNSAKAALKVELPKFKGTRQIRKDVLCYFNKEDKHFHLRSSNVITVFDSILTRLIDCTEKRITKNLIVIKNFYYPVMESLITNGFNFGNIHYKYLSSGSGQIKDHKMVFIRESTLNKEFDDGSTRESSLMCGLTWDRINAYEDKDGHYGVNPNKFNSYLSLSASASIEWPDFPINHLIVVPDYSTNVTDKFDYLEQGEDKKYRLTERGEKMPVSIDSFDGFGVIDESISSESFIFRAPWCKGLLTPAPLKNFFNKKKNDKGELWIDDVWGDSHDVIKDEISMVMTASQLKMWRYYDSQKDFVRKYNDNHCKAAIQMKNDVRDYVNLNYQFLQTLNLNDNQLNELAADRLDFIDRIGSDKDTMFRCLGADDENIKKNCLQKSLSIYPELINDDYCKEQISSKKSSLIKDTKGGKFPIEGKHNVFILPDVYNFLSRLVGEDEHLLKKNEVSCSMFENGETLDVLRSPHLYMEHAIQTNKVNEDTKKWFITNGIYISNHSSITLLIMADFDGDHVSVTNNQMLIDAAQKQKKKFDIYPLYYKMFSSKPVPLNEDSIYKSLKAAYTQNIGEISNAISKIWNSEDPDLDAIRYLVCRNNFTIDYSKTLKQVEFDEDNEKLIKGYMSNSEKLPHFFIYAKDKKKDQVSDKGEKNISTVNRLDDLVNKVNHRISFIKIGGKFDYSMLMKRENVNFNKRAKAIIEKYDEINQNKKSLMPKVSTDESDKKKPQTYFYQHIREELRKICHDEKYITDVLVKYLYENGSKYKETFWHCYGKYIFENLEFNLKHTKECKQCGARIPKIQRKQYCSKCARRKEKARLRNRKNKQKVS